MSRLPSIAAGDEWWSTIAVVPASRASTAPRRADQRISSGSRARSSLHQTSSRISANEVGTRDGAGMPRASVEYR